MNATNISCQSTMQYQQATLWQNPLRPFSNSYSGYKTQVVHYRFIRNTRQITEQSFP